MKEEPFEHDVHFVIQPLHFVSKIFGMCPFHIDPKYRYDNERLCNVLHNMLATFMIVMLLFGLYSNMVYATELIDPTFNIIVRVVWVISVVTAYSSSILGLIFSITRNKNHMTAVLASICRVDKKLLHRHNKQNIYTSQRSHVMMQLKVMFILLGIVFSSCAYSFYNGTWTCLMFMISQILSVAINIVNTLQYVNVILIVKQRYQLMKHLLLKEVLSDSCSRNPGPFKSHNANKLFLTTDNLKNYKDSSNVCRIRDLRMVHSELYDVIHENNNSYGIVILLEFITVLTYSVFATYFGVITMNDAVFNNGNFEIYFKGITLLSMCAFELLAFFWLTTCCNSTAEEFNATLIHIQKLLLYPYISTWTIVDLKSFSSQLKNVKIEFNICGFFNLNLHFFCASVGGMFTYIIVLSQFNQKV
ncbi:hypothetical protein L798_07004 [Zootermopsis nevadensis]|uniref:Gustatory receptor n=1 Tax=Zootermopsis nevadensis TaxID=136037 RepID=A0A067RIK5_ZOONE|nr:hypothetical protein L798_07004 [Zootermopsis nevadensis]